MNIFESIYSLFIKSEQTKNFLNGFCVLGQNDKGIDITSADYFTIFGASFLLWGIIAYIVFYHLISNAKYTKRKQWWLVCILLLVINFLTPFLYFISLTNEDMFSACSLIKSNVALIMGIANAVLGFIWYLIFTTLPYPRKFSTHASQSTFYN